MQSIALLLAFVELFVYLAEMTKRKPLTPEEIAAADRLKAIWDKKQVKLELTQEKAAELLGIGTQGGVSHYLNKKTPINLPILIRFSRLLKVPAFDIYPEMAKEFLGDYVDFIDETEKRIIQTTRKMSVEKRAEVQRKIDSIAEPEGNGGDAPKRAAK